MDSAAKSLMCFNEEGAIMSEACRGSATTATAHARAQHSLRADGPKIHSTRSGLPARLRKAAAAYAAPPPATASRSRAAAQTIAWQAGHLCCSRQHRPYWSPKTEWDRAQPLLIGGIIRLNQLIQVAIKTK